MSSEPIGDIQLTRPSFFITPSHVQVSLRTTAGYLWLYNFLVALEQNLSQKANDFVSKRFSMTQKRTLNILTALNFLKKVATTRKENRNSTT